MKIEADFDTFLWDFEEHVKDLTGLTKFLRLAAIYNAYPVSCSLRNKVGSIFVECLTKSSCTGIFRRVSGDALTLLRENSTITSWEQITDIHMTEILSVLELELHQAKSMAVKETIRSGYFHLGLHYWQWGRVEDALKYFLKSREFTSVQQHHIDVTLHMVSCYFDIGQLVNAAGFCTKLQDLAQDSATLLRSKALLGLFAIQERNYVSAAYRFLELDGDIGSEWGFLLSGSDVGFYGSLCALLSFCRTQLRTSLVENKSFQLIYLHGQPEIKNFIVKAYEKNDYSEAVPFLKWLKTRLLLDLHLHSFSEEIVQQVHDRLFVQYLEPFASVTLQRLADDFKLSIDNEVRSTLIELVTTHKVNARIDFRNGRILRGPLVASSSFASLSTQRRRKLLEKMMITQDEHIINMKRALLLLSLRKVGIVVKSSLEEPVSNDMNSMPMGGGKAARVLGGGRAAMSMARSVPSTHAGSAMMLDTEEPEDDVEDTDSKDVDGHRTRMDASEDESASESYSPISSRFNPLGK
jgi:COP9 signalosome complex subunit 1